MVTPTYTYDYGANIPNDQIRLLVADTGSGGTFVFADQEITSMIFVVQQTFQSGMFWSPPAGPPGGGTLGSYLPGLPIPYLRVGAYLLNSLAANSARLANVTKLLDVTLNPAAAAKALSDQAKTWLDIDDNSGAFMVIEQCSDEFSFRDRYWKQVQRQGWGG